MSDAQERAKTGRKPRPAEEKLKVVPVRMNDAQKAVLAIIGHQALRDWLDKQGRALARAAK